MRLGFSTVLALCLFGLTACGQSSPQQRQRDTSNLSRSLAVLEQFQVSAYRNQDWCKNIAYEQGKFSDNLDSTCNLFTGQSQAFTSQAKTDFAQVEKTLKQSKVRLHYLSVDYVPNGKIRRAEFALSSGGNSYVYEPGYKLPKDVPNELEYSAINQDWYYFWQDWN